MSQAIIQMGRRYSDADIAGLIRPGRVHSRVYTDEALFELEIEKIFSVVWVYVGHESEVPRPGDYQMRTIGRTPVLMVRGTDNKVRVLINRCRHRGAQVCETESGNTKFFKCWYHGWTYDSSGSLTQITGEDAYGPDFKRSEMGLSAAPRVESYRGFVFASLAKSGESLGEYLGTAANKIDYLVDASPTGEIFADGGIYKTEYKGNWKLVGMDGYHPHFVHASVFAAMQRNPEHGIGATHREDPFEDAARTRTVDFGHGHAMIDFRRHRINHYEVHTEYLKKTNGGAEYVEAMHKSHGADRARQLITLAGDPHLGVFPNLQLIQNQIRIITPVSAGVTQVTMTAVRLGGVSDEINAMRMRQQESFYGPAGSGSPDDAEIFERVQRGMMAEVNPWVEISRGMGREERDEEGNTVGLISDEVPQRGMMTYWLDLMRADTSNRLEAV
jgi:phenylpropionate dioxygenase-like ring-hydroxylating dioxygenase large terminal subunit